MDEVIEANATEVTEEAPEQFCAWIGPVDQYQKILDILSEKLNAMQTAMSELSAEIAEFVGQFQDVIPEPNPPVQE